MTYNYAGYVTGVWRMTPTHVWVPGYIVSLISDHKGHVTDKGPLVLTETPICFVRRLGCSESSLYAPFTYGGRKPVDP